MRRLSASGGGLPTIPLASRTRSSTLRSPRSDCSRTAPAEFPDRDACIHLDHKLDVRQLRDMARRTAHLFVHLGVQPGDRVGMLLPNVPEFLSDLNGIWMAGAAAVAISPLSVSEEVSALVCGDRLPRGCRARRARAALLGRHVQPEISRPDHAQRPAARLEEVRSIGSPGNGGFSAMSRSRQGRAFWFERRVDTFQPRFRTHSEPASLDVAAFLLATGGTTGHPKAVALSHRNLVANATQIHAWAGTQMGHDSVLAVIPSSIVTACRPVPSPASRWRRRSSCTIALFPRRCPQLIENYQPTVMPAVPAMLVGLNDLLRTERIHSEEPAILHFRRSAARSAGRGGIRESDRSHRRRRVWTF